MTPYRLLADLPSPLAKSPTLQALFSRAIVGVDVHVLAREVGPDDRARLPAGAEVDLHLDETLVRREGRALLLRLRRERAVPRSG